MTLHTLVIIIATSLACTGAHVLFMEDKPLFRVRIEGDAHWPKIIRYPLYECLPCMASLWGVPMLIYMMEWPPAADLLIATLAVLGLNTIIALWINRKKNDDTGPEHPHTV